MSDTRYTDQHEWISLDGDVGTVGISTHAQEQLGDVVYVELPEIGRTVDRGAELAVVESVKAASEIYAPVAGEVVAVNEALNDEPGLVNSDAEDAGWFVKLKVANAADVDGLKDAAAYKDYVDGLA